MVNRKDRELPGRATDRDRDPLTANATATRFFEKIAGRLARPIQRFPIERTKAAITAKNDRVQTCVIVVNVAQHPIIGVGQGGVLVASRIDGMINEVIDFETVTKRENAPL